MFWAVVPLSRYTRDYGAVLGITTAYLVPMAAWVALGPWLGFVRGTTFNPQWRQIAPPVGTLQGQAHRPPPGARAVERLASQGPMGSNPRGTRPGRGHSVEKSFFKRLFSSRPLTGGSNDDGERNFSLRQTVQRFQTLLDHLSAHSD